MVLHDLLIMHRFVIEARDIHFVGEMVANRVLPLIKSRSRRPGRIFLMKKTSKALGFFPAINLFLFRNLIADAPQDDAGMIAVTAYHVAQVTLRPFVVVLAVTVG